jgi:2,6-dihydroxypseudooxynicotine hydrolase
LIEARGYGNMTRAASKRSGATAGKEKKYASTAQSGRGGEVMQRTPASDPRVAAALSHWAPRFVTNGVALTDFEEVTASIRSWDDWCGAWSARAAQHEAIGRDALAREKFLSAGEHLQRAGVYYHFGKFLFVHDLAQMKAAHMKAVECRRLALPYLRPPGERVEMPYQGHSLAGILRKPPGIERPPVLIFACGLDSTKEETDAYEQPFLARGIATLAFDGPGQGEAEYDFAIRGDYEVAAQAVLDFIESRRDLDAGRIGIAGISLGGYYAPRAAAFDARIKACLALSGPYDWAACWDGVPDLTREAFRVRSKSATLDEARSKAATLTLAGVAHRIACPIYIMTGSLDRIVPPRDAERLAREVSGPVVLNIVAEGNHIANNRPYRWRTQSADWMAEQLRAAGS